MAGDLCRRICLWSRGCLRDPRRRRELRDDTSRPYKSAYVSKRRKEAQSVLVWRYHGKLSSASTGRLAALRLPFAALFDEKVISLEGAGTSMSMPSSKSDILGSWMPVDTMRAVESGPNRYNQLVIRSCRLNMVVGRLGGVVKVRRVAARQRGSDALANF